MSVDSIVISIEAGSVTTSLAVEPISGLVFRVLECTWLIEAFDYDDVIEVSTTGSDVFRFVRVVRPSKLKRWSAILSRSSCSSPSLESLLDKIAESGGYWERAFGGVLFVALPTDSEIDIDAAIAAGRSN